MKRFYLFLLLLCAQSVLAQFTENDVQYWVGEGPDKAFLVVDFKDGTDDASYAWGFRFDSADQKTMYDLFLDLKAAEPNFDSDASYNNSFLDLVSFNDHMGENGEDYWSIWNGNSHETLAMNAGIGNKIQPNKWYGVSYGFNPPTAPALPLPAYSSKWFKAESISHWYGEGSNQSIVIIDFGTNTDNQPDSYAFGVKYNTATISYTEILTLLANEVSGLDISQTNNGISSLSFLEHTGSASDNENWNVYKGTDLSNWVTQTHFSGALSNNEWLGLSFAKRRPITPKDGYSLGKNTFRTIAFTIYPNPTSDIVHINSQDAVRAAILYDSYGKVLQKTTRTHLNLSTYSSGVYFVEVITEKGKATQKIIKK